MYKVRVNPLALKDLEEIKAYITEELGAPDAAIGVVKKIISRYEQLVEYPMMGPELSTVLDVNTNFRYLVSDNYTIFYQVEGTCVSINRILYGGRDDMRILFCDLSGES